MPQQPHSPYLRSVVVLSLYELRQHLRDHTYFEVVSNISTHNPAAFNAWLAALQALHYEDFAGLSACFAQATDPATDPAPGPAPGPAGDEYALAARYAASALASEATSAAAVSLREQYQKQYAGGKFDQLLFPAPKGKAGTSRR